MKRWGSGCRANFQLQCLNGQVSFNFSAQLGAPADRHFVPHEPHPQHGPHAPLPPRRKSPQQRERDRARAAAHRASMAVKETADPADPQREHEADPADPQTELEDDDLTPLKPPPEADPAAPSHSPLQAVPAAIPKEAAAAAASLTPPEAAVPATLSEVRDEVVYEQSEVKVYATGVFENCPDRTLTEDYYESLRKFATSETHLEDNIASVKMAHLSSRQLGPQLFVHLVNVEITVRTAQLWEPASAYLQKHLSSNDWLKGNKTRITLMNIK